MRAAAIIPRTPQGALIPGFAALLLLVSLMFVGGSPASCAGGIRRTTFAIWLASLRARLSGKDDATLMGRTIPRGISSRVSPLIGLAVLWNYVGLLVLTSTECEGRPVVMQEALFGRVSAFGTVGLSTGLTPYLTAAGKIWIVLTMFVGRVGPLTMAAWVPRNGTVRVKYPKESVLIG